MQVMDEATALSRVGDDRELLQDLASLFLRESSKLLKAIEDALATGNPQQLKVAAHSMKGSVDTFAARPAYEAAFQLETLGRSGTMAGTGDAFLVLKKEVDRLICHLQELALGTTSKN